eukprot:SAG31_NODE_1649_length_7638_cov_19.225096_5_plen_134_part_00
MFTVMGEMAKKPGDGYKGASVFILANTKVAVLFFLYEPLKAFVLQRQAAAGGSADLITGANAALIAGEGCYFLVFVQLFEKYGTLIERFTALIEKVSPCSGFAWHRRLPALPHTPVCSHACAELTRRQNQLGL